MKPEIFDLFPLSVFKDKILLQPNEKQEIIEYIFDPIIIFKQRILSQNIFIFYITFSFPTIKALF